MPILLFLFNNYLSTEYQPNKGELQIEYQCNVRPSFTIVYEIYGDKLAIVERISPKIKNYFFTFVGNYFLKNYAI